MAVEAMGKLADDFINGFYRYGLQTYDCLLHSLKFKKILASSGPYGPLLARSGYPGQDASFYNNPMVIICATVNALMQLKLFYASFYGCVQLEML